MMGSSTSSATSSMRSEPSSRSSSHSIAVAIASSLSANTHGDRDALTAYRFSMNELQKSPSSSNLKQQLLTNTTPLKVNLLERYLFFPQLVSSTHSANKSVYEMSLHMLASRCRLFEVNSTSMSQLFHANDEANFGYIIVNGSEARSGTQVDSVGRLFDFRPFITRRSHDRRASSPNASIHTPLAHSNARSTMRRRHSSPSVSTSNPMSLDCIAESTFKLEATQGNQDESKDNGGVSNELHESPPFEVQLSNGECFGFESLQEVTRGGVQQQQVPSASPFHSARRMYSAEAGIGCLVLAVPYVDILLFIRSTKPTTHSSLPALPSIATQKATSSVPLVSLLNRSWLHSQLCDHPYFKQFSTSAVATLCSLFTFTQKSRGELLAKRGVKVTNESNVCVVARGRVLMSDFDAKNNASNSVRRGSNAQSVGSCFGEEILLGIVEKYSTALPPLSQTMRAPSSSSSTSFAQLFKSTSLPAAHSYSAYAELDDCLLFQLSQQKFQDFVEWSIRSEQSLIKVPTLCNLTSLHTAASRSASGGSSHNQSSSAKLPLHPSHPYATKCVVERDHSTDDEDVDATSSSGSTPMSSDSTSAQMTAVVHIRPTARSNPNNPGGVSDELLLTHPLFQKVLYNYCQSIGTAELMEFYRDCRNFRQGVHAKNLTVHEEAVILYRAYVQVNARKFICQLSKVTRDVITDACLEAIARTEASMLEGFHIQRSLFHGAEMELQALLLGESMIGFKRTSNFIKVGPFITFDPKLKKKLLMEEQEHDANQATSVRLPTINNSSADDDVDPEVMDVSPTGAFRAQTIAAAAARRIN